MPEILLRETNALNRSKRQNKRDPVLLLDARWAIFRPSVVENEWGLGV